MPNLNRSTLKALDVLECLAPAEQGLALTEISELTGYPISTTHRLLASLLERGYVQQEQDSKRYFLGSRILSLQSQGIRGRHLSQVAYPVLNTLKHKVQATVNLGILSGVDIVYIETFAPDSSLAFYLPPGTRMPSHCTAIGKLLLAYLTPELQQAYLDDITFESYTPHTITSLSSLRDQLRQIVEQGYSLDDQEYALGVRCLAAPICDSSGVIIAGASMTFRVEYLPSKNIASTAKILTEACNKISKMLGCRNPNL